MAAAMKFSRDEIAGYLNRRPFVPFFVTLSDGSVHPVVRVAQMAIGQTIGTIAEAKGNKARNINLSEIVSIDEKG